MICHISYNHTPSILDGLDGCYECYSYFNFFNEKILQQIQAILWWPVHYNILNGFSSLMPDNLKFMYHFIKGIKK